MRLVNNPTDRSNSRVGEQSTIYSVGERINPPLEEFHRIDGEYKIRVNLTFETQSDLLRGTIIDRAGEQIVLPDGGVDPHYVRKQNAALDWV